MRTKLRFAGRFVIVIALALNFAMVAPPTQTSAINHIGRMYFSGAPGTVSYGNCALILNGYTGGANKETFINFILNAFNTPFGKGCGGGKKVGAAYIIQTMRGVPIGSNRLPSNAEIQDWENLIRQPSVQISTENYSYTVDSAMKYNSSKMFSGVDVGMFNRSDTAPSTVFRQTGKGIVYVMRNPCGNPVGDNPGIVNMPLNYTLNPSISANQTAAEAGSSVTLSPTVNNTGQASSTNTQWQLSQFIVSPTGSYPGAGNSPSAPAQYYGNNLTRLDGGTGASFAVGNHVLSNPTETVPDYPAGSKVCYALSVQQRSDSDGQWAHSNPVCLVIAKKPKIEILGGDVSVGQTYSGIAASGNIDTSTSVKNIGGGQSTFGSWVEYGAFASGTISGLGSGSAFSAKTGLAATGVCDYSKLTFTNAGSLACSTSTPKGGYLNTQAIPDVAASFTGGVDLGVSPTLNITTQKPQGAYAATGTISIVGGTLAAGEWFVLNAPNANVVITGDMHYTTDTLHTIADIPQAVIIAKNITINDSVKNVDAWLIAKPTGATDGTINTCSSAAPLTINICKDQLTINGPVMAQKLFLNRTAGSGTATDSGFPAEIFNLRPDAFLWSYRQAVSAGRIQSAYTTELPPRF